MLMIVTDKERPVRNSSFRLPIIAAALTLTFLHANDANATVVCTVQPSPDGFVALRAKPAEDAEVMVKAQAGDAIVIQQNANGDWIEDGKWLSVFHYPGEIVPEATDPEYANGKIGWMYRSFVSDCG